MNSGTALLLMGALGGLTAFSAGVWAVVRGIFGQTAATKANTTAVINLTSRMDELASQVHDNTERIARVERRRRP